MAKNWDDAARIVWDLLTSAASEGQTLTYSDIAPKIRTNPLSVRNALGPIQDYCLSEQLPPLTSLVIGKWSGIPGTGFIAWSIDDLKRAHRIVRAFDWSVLGNPFEVFDASTSADTLTASILADSSQAAEVYARIKVRGIAQRIFRKALLIAYDNECAICGFSFEAALDAAHIKSWGNSAPSERLDVKNGLLLGAIHHRLFDARFLTVTTAHRVHYVDPIMVEYQYSKLEEALTAGLHGSKLRLPKTPAHRPSPNYIVAHHKERKWLDVP